jgi:hypothetical protein
MPPTVKIHFRCPFCDKPVSAPIEYANKRCKCPSCGTAVVVPAAPEACTPAPLADAPTPLANDYPSSSPSLPLDLARRGWKPYRFKDSQVIVLLPEGLNAAFDPEGVLIGTLDGKAVHFSATLHGGFEGNRVGALDFVNYLAKGRGLKVRERGTYRYFFDPTDAPPKAIANRFWVIGIPGAVVVVSILGTRKRPVSDLLREIKEEIPRIVGELL